MTCHSLLDLLCALPACCLRMAPLLLLSPPRRFLPSGPSLQKACMLTVSPGPSASTRTSSWTCSVPAPSHCPRSAMLLLLFLCNFAPDCRNIMQQDYCRILVVAIPVSRNSCFFISFLSPAFPITLNHPFSPSLSPLLQILINRSDQHLDCCFLISCQVYIYQRTSSPSYRLERDNTDRFLLHL